MCDQILTLTQRRLSPTCLALDLCGSLNNGFSQPLHDFLADLRNTPAWNILINFSGIEDVDNRGLKLMMDFCVSLRRLSRKLFCYGLSENLLQALREARLDLFLHIFPSEERALESIRFGGQGG